MFIENFPPREKGKGKKFNRVLPFSPAADFAVFDVEIIMIFDPKEMFREIYDLPNRTFAEEAFDYWCSKIPDWLPEFQSLCDTFISRREHILNYFDESFTNAFAESANNIIKSIEKQGKGYDFDTLRKIALFSSRVEQPGKFDYKTSGFTESYRF